MKLSAKELLPKLKTRRENGNNDFIVTLRFDRAAANESTMKQLRSELIADYGDAASYEIIERGDPDKLGDLMTAGQVAVRAVYDINKVIEHVEAKL